MKSSGQASIEIVALAPLCVAAAIGLVEVGTVAADAYTLERAAGAAAVTAIDGGDAEASVRRILPDRLERSLAVQTDQGSIRVAVTRPLFRQVGGITLSRSARYSMGAAQ